MPTPPRTYHGAEPPGDLEDGAGGGFEPTAWASIATDMVGTVIDGRYRVDALLGAGAMAFVLAGQHVHLGKRVALKVLHPELAELGELRARFQREARAASRVAHPAVIEVTDFGVSEDGLYYLVMEHLSGQDLQRWVSQRGRLAPDVVAGIGRQLAGALEAIHQAGFVHRDIKPENIFVLDGDEAVPVIKVLDLGIAAVSAQRANKDDPRLTRAGQTLGTVSFMAPEQVAARPLDGRVDIYAAGCVLFELLTGHLPFEAETPTEIMMAHLREPARDVRSLRPEVPDWLADVIARCLAKKPEDRFPDALALGRALEPGPIAVAPAPSETTGVEPRETSIEDAPRRTRGWLAVAFGAGLVVTVASAALLTGADTRREEPASTGSDLAVVPVAVGRVASEPGATPGTAPEAPTGPTASTMEDAKTEADANLSTVADTLETDTMAPDAMAIRDTTTADTGPGAEPDAKGHDASVEIQAPESATRPKVKPRDRPRTEPEPSAPKADTLKPETPKTPSGLWRPRPPSGGDD